MPPKISRSNEQLIFICCTFVQGSSTKKALIGGVAGGVGLILLLVALVVLFALSRKRKRPPRGTGNKFLNLELGAMVLNCANGCRGGQGNPAN